MRNEQNKDNITLKQKLLSWAHNNRYIVGIIIIAGILSQVKPVIQGVEFLCSWISEKYEIVFPKSFDKDRKTFNVLLLEFKRVEKDQNYILSIEEAIRTRFLEIIEKTDAKLQIIYDSRNCPNNDLEAEKIGKQKEAELVIYGTYFEKGSCAEIEYLFLTQEISLLMFSDSLVRFEGTINNPQDSFVTFSYKKSTGVIKFDNLSDISSLSNKQLLRKIDNFVYVVLSLNEFYAKNYSRSYELTSYFQFSNDKDDIQFYEIQLACLGKLKDNVKYLEVCNKLIQLDPRSPYFYFNRGMCYSQLNDIKKAIADYSLSIALKPDMEVALVNRGSLYVHMKKYKLAILDFSKILEKNAKSIAALSKRALVLIELKKFAEALEDLNLAMSLNDKRSDLYVNRGVCKKNMGQFDAALVDLNMAINLDSNNVLAYFNRGSLYQFNFKDIQNAIIDYSTVISKEKKFYKAYLFRYHCHIQTQEHDKQIEDLDALIELDSDNSEFYNSRGYNYVLISQFEKAINDFDKCLQLKKDYAFAYNNRGWAYANLNHFDKAMSDYAISFKLNPHNDYVYVFRGLTRYKMGEYKLALQDLKKVLNKNKEYSVEIKTAITEIEKKLKEKH